MNALTLNRVCYTYPGSNKRVLHQVCGEFETGKLYAVMGKSGAGKSTLLALISGLDLATEGQVLVSGEDLRKMNRDEYRAKKIGVVYQGYNLLTEATALDNILLSMHISGVKPEPAAALTLLEQVGIDKQTARRPVLRLSGGEQQRVAIARALSHAPDIIIADEPTGNLDGENEDNILDIFENLAHRDGKCVILVTHSKHVGSRADEVWGLNQGILTLVK